MKSTRARACCALPFHQKSGGIPPEAGPEAYLHGSLRKAASCVLSSTHGTFVIRVWMPSAEDPIVACGALPRVCARGRDLLQRPETLLGFLSEVIGGVRNLPESHGGAT